MNPITIPNHLVTPTAIAIIGIILLLIFRRRINNSLFIGTLTFLAFYAFIVGTAVYDDIYSQWHLNQFDLNQDGVFSGDELTPEQDEAMSELTNDVGRNFSFITGGIAGFILGLAAYIFSRIFERIKPKLRDT